MSVLNCCTPCSEVQTVNVPGPEGDAGVNGTDGQNAYTNVTADFVVPADGNTVDVDVTSAVWMVVGQVLIVGVGWDGVGVGPATFRVSSFISSTRVRLTKLVVGTDVAAGTTITAGSTVSPSAV